MRETLTPGKNKELKFFIWIVSMDCMLLIEYLRGQWEIR